MLDVQLRGANALREMAVQLRKADREDLGRALQRGIRAAAKPTLDDVKESARSIHSRGLRKPGAKHPFVRPVPDKGTRRKIADSVTATVSVLADSPRVQFRAGRGLPEGLKGLARRWDEPGTFRHPVMGNRKVWVGQTGDPWFFEPIHKNLKTFRGAIDGELDKVREQLERG